MHNSISMCRLQWQNRHVAECPRPITIRGKAFRKIYEHFHSISCPFRCYEIHHTECAAALRTPRIRAADTFICSATNTSHLYKAPIYLAQERWSFYAYTDVQRRALFTCPDSLIPWIFPCFITFAITAAVQSRESWNHLYINPPLFSVITIQCYYILGPPRNVLSATCVLYMSLARALMSSISPTFTFCFNMLSRNKGVADLSLFVGPVWKKKDGKVFPIHTTGYWGDNLTIITRYYSDI